jgi:aminoglycoside phosphotransferase (APT) family kinase protein
VLHIPRELVRLGRDRLPVSRELPRRLGDVDAAVLSRLLGREVTAVERIGGTEGTTDRAQLRLRVDGVERSTFVKMPSHATGTRLFGGLARLGATEVGFYRDLRPLLGVEAPEALGAAYCPRTGRFLIVLEDLEARGATFADTLTDLSVDTVAAALETLAGVHATPIPRLPWLGSNSTDPMLPLICRALKPLSRKASQLPDEGLPILASYREVARSLDEGPQALLHGDPHPGNLYLVDGRVGLLDWQVVRRGNPMRDVTYLMVLALPPEVRRAHQSELLAHYLKAGDSGLSLEQADAEFRRMVAYVYVATTFTSGLGGLQGTSIADEGLRRAVEALQEA